MRRTRSYAKFLAFALAVSLAFQSAPAMAEKFDPTVDTAGTGAVYGTVPDDDTSSIAIGNGSTVQESTNPIFPTADAIAVGTDAAASANKATAIGSSATASGISSTAIGSSHTSGSGRVDTIASGGYSTAVGTGAQALGSSSIALGMTAKAEDSNSIALGYYSTASLSNSVAIGNTARANGLNSIAIGYSAKVGTETASANNSIAIGNNATVGEGVTTSVALGYYSEATEADVVSIGSTNTKRRLVNMDKGRADTDAVNVGQLNSALDIFGNNTTVSSENGTITNKGFTYRDDTTTTTVQEAFDEIGTDIDELDETAVKYTGTSRLTLTDSGTLVQIGNVAAAEIAGASTYAVNGAQLYAIADSIADRLGVDYNGGVTMGDFSVDINGTNYTNVAEAIEKLAEGWNIKNAAGTGGTGTPGTGTGSGTVLPGGSLNVEAGDNNIEISVGGTGGDANLNISVSDNPTFDSVTAGSITANDKVTVGTGDNQTVIDGTTGTVTVGTGDNQTKIDATNGTVTVGDSSSDTYTEIGSGNLHVHTNIGGVNGGVLANNIGLQVYNENGDQVWINNEGTVYITSNGNSVTLANGTGTFTNDNGTTSIDGGNVEVSNQITVGGADGTVINNGSVSINNNSAYFRENAMKVGSMTYDGLSNTLDMGGAGRLTGLADGGVYMGSTDAVTGNQLWQAYKRMDQLQEGINIVGAHAAALSGLHPIDYNPYEPTTLSAAVGTYRDEYAVAVGVFHYVRENVLFNLGASICSDGDLMGRAGISFTVGRGGDKKKALAPKDMNEVQAQLAEVRQALHELKAENAALKVRLDAKSK